MNGNKRFNYPYNNDIPLKEDYMEKKQQKSSDNSDNKLSIVPYTIIIIILSVTLLFGFINIVNWFTDNKEIKTTTQSIVNNTNIIELEDNYTTTLINEPKELTDDYWYYIKFPLIEVNFDTLQKKNKDTIAWIQVNSTNINYPIVKTNNNDYYLNHAYDHSINEAGWVFMDYRNNGNFSNQNTIIYAHSRLNKTMFGSLSKVLKESWFENKDNHIINISTPTENSLWQIFSVYKIKEETYYITTDFSNDNDYLSFLNTLKNRSKFNFNTTLTENDTIITLSTCYSDTERTVVHAKKIKSMPHS